jgi:hypothetical protein
MKKRVFAGVLWLYATWYAWSVIATLIGVSTAPGPLFGLLAALLLAGDPLHRIWSQPAARAARVGARAPSADPI